MVAGDNSPPTGSSVRIVIELNQLPDGKMQTKINAQGADVMTLPSMLMVALADANRRLAQVAVEALRTLNEKKIISPRDFMRQYKGSN